MKEVNIILLVLNKSNYILSVVHVRNSLNKFTKQDNILTDNDKNFPFLVTHNQIMIINHSSGNLASTHDSLSRDRMTSNEQSRNRRAIRMNNEMD